MGAKTPLLLLVSAVLASASIAPAGTRIDPPGDAPSARTAGHTFVAENGTVRYEGDATRTTHFAYHLGRTNGDAREAARRVAADSLVKLGAPAELLESRSASPSGAVVVGVSVDYVLPAGDLDGDGARDLIGLRWGPVSDSLFGFSNQLTITALRGIDGSFLWSRAEPLYYGFALPARVGADGADGVMLVAYDFDGVGAFVASAGFPKLRVVGISGAGETVWERVFLGADGGTIGLYAGYAFPYFASLLDATEGPATDALVATETFAGTLVAFTTSVTTTVLDGADGAMVGQSETVGVLQEPSPFPAPDLSGDGLDDYLVVSPGVYVPLVAEEPMATASAHRGTDGDELWSSTTIPLSYFTTLADAGDATGDGRADLILANQDFYYEFFYYGEQFDTVFLLNGADGTTLWGKPGSFTRGLGDINGDGRAEVGIQTVDIEYGDHAAVRYDAFDGAGSAVYSFTHSVPTPRSSRSEVRIFPAPGDVEPDFSPDAAHSIVVADFELATFSVDRGMVSGRTGSTLWTGRVGEALGDTVDGSGDDLAVLMMADPTTLEIVVNDGATNKTIWHGDKGVRTVTVAPDAYARALAADVDADGRAEIILNTFAYDDTGYETAIFVLSARTGQILWTIRSATEIQFAAVGTTS
jgi:hypothetical protein